jgi:dephospho-CoA kinase
MPKIIFITGASGVGKTTILSTLQKKLPENSKQKFFHFDDIGVPSFEKMIEEYGSPENWQKKMTEQWVKKLTEESKDLELCILEGQVNIQFIADAFSENNFENYQIVLIDCSEEDMQTRLTERGQKDLFTEDMKNWRKFLHAQSTEKNISVINTSGKSEEESVEELKNIIF